MKRVQAHWLPSSWILRLASKKSIKVTDHIHCVEFLNEDGYVIMLLLYRLFISITLVHCVTACSQFILKIKCMLNSDPNQLGCLRPLMSEHSGATRTRSSYRRLYPQSTILRVATKFRISLLAFLVLL